MNALMDRMLLGWRADGRAVWLARGGADGDGGAGESGTQGGANGGSGEGGAGGATADGEGDGTLEFTEENFQQLIDNLNKERAERAAREAELEQRLQETSRDAARNRVRNRQLLAMVGDDGAASGKGAGGGKKKEGQDGSAAAEGGASPEVERLAAQLRETREAMRASEARAELLEADAKPGAVKRLVRLLDLDPDAEETASIPEQIAQLKAELPELFGAKAQSSAAANGGAGGAAAAAKPTVKATVAGRGSAGRPSGSAPKADTADVLAARLGYGPLAQQNNG